ncbi:MAG: PfkB family carbohydrate kinase [Enterocloster bolteae]
MWIIFSPLRGGGQRLPAKKDLEEIAGTLLDCGVRNVIIKIGKRGCFIKNQEEAFIVPAFADTQCLDTTGAGDALLHLGFIARPAGGKRGLGSARHLPTALLRYP